MSQELTIVKIKIYISLPLLIATGLTSQLLLAENELARSDNKVSVEITPKLYFFDYHRGVDGDRTQFLERYNYQESGSNSRSGFYPDADISILVSNPRRNVFSLERQGYGIYTHRGRMALDMDKIGLAGYYRNFRSSTGGIDFLYSPNQVPGGTDPLYTSANSGYVARFNDDSNGQTRYSIDRLTYGGGLALKPELFGSMGSLTFSYDGYQRDGNRFATFVLGGGDVNSAAPNTGTQQRWRGFDMPVNEQMNRFSVNLSGAPGGLQLTYDGSIEKFQNRANDFTLANFANFGANSDRIIPSNAPIHFIPDSTLLTNNFQLTKNFGLTAIGSGYGLSILDQDSFTQNQLAAGYGTGKIVTNSAFLNINSAVLSWAGLEGYAKYYNRDNDSTFPASGLIDPFGAQELGVRINTIESFTYGLAATFRPRILKSTITVGWKGENTGRDLTWTDASIVTGLNGIQPQRSLYQQRTFSNEGYISWVTRPLDGLIIRITPSYLRASQTGLLTEPAESLNLKSTMSYLLSDSILLSGYYHFTNRKNNNNSLAFALTTPVITDGFSLKQNTNNSQQSAGISLSFTPDETLSTTASFSWMRNDFTTYLITSNRRRFEAPGNTVLFALRDRPNYLVDTYVFSINTDWQAAGKLSFSSGYTLSHSRGHTATGYTGNQLRLATGDVDQQIDNMLHHLALGANYSINDSLKLRGSYGYSFYQDKAFNTLTGGYHFVMIGASLRF